MIIDGIEIGFLQIIFITIMIICALLLAREVRTWYWRINEIIKNQEEQLDQMEKVINELDLQNKKLLTLINEIRQQNKSKENDKSTP